MAVDIKSFLSDLKMELKVLMCNKFTIDRISNMTQKTNQFNLTTKRYTQAELQDFINKGSLIYCLNVKDDSNQHQHRIHYQYSLNVVQ